MTRLFFTALALYAAFTLGRGFDPKTEMRSVGDYGDEVVYNSGYDAGYLEGLATCHELPLTPFFPSDDVRFEKINH